MYAGKILLLSHIDISTIKIKDEDIITFASIITS